MNGSCHERVQEVERLAKELHELMNYSQSVLYHRGMHREARGLVHWVDCYRDGLRYGIIADDKPVLDGSAWLAGVSDRLKLESQQMMSDHWLDDEEDTAEIEAATFIESARQIIRTAADADDMEISFPSSGFKRAYEAYPATTRKGGGMMQTRVKDLMNKNLVIIPPDYTLKEAAQEMEVVNCGVLPVGTEDKIEGIITDRDIVLRAVARGKDVNKELVRDYMTPEVCAVHEDDATYRAADLMREKNINRVLVKDEAGKPRGILTFGRILRKDDNMQEIAIVIECAVGQKVA